MASPRPSPLTLTLSGAQPQFAAGSLPDLKATLTNRAPKPVAMCAYMLGPRLLASLTAENQDGEEFELFPFKPGRWVRLKPTDFKTIPPGKAFSIRLPIATSQVWKFVASGSQPPIVNTGFAQPGFTGEMIFRTRLSDQMALYIGKSGVYDRQWEWRKVPDELQDAPSPVPPLFRRTIRGRGVVKFG